jgi:hypothetical protein
MGIEDTFNLNECNSQFWCITCQTLPASGKEAWKPNANTEVLLPAGNGKLSSDLASLAAEVAWLQRGASTRPRPLPPV